MSENFTYTDILPDVVDGEHPYIGIGDLLAVSKRFDPSVRNRDVRQLQDEIFKIQKKIVPDEATFIATSGKKLSKRLRKVAYLESRRTDANVGVVIMDRYIKTRRDNPSLFRLDVSRDRKGGQVTRPGVAVDINRQYENLKSWGIRSRLDEVVLIDDVIGTGSTLIRTIHRVRRALPLQKIRVISGIATSGGEVWSGLEKIHKATGVRAEYLTLQRASRRTDSSTGLSICNSRDMTFLGGYLEPGEDKPRRNVPHFLPFTVTVPKNLTSPNKRELAASMLLEFNMRFVDFLEVRMNRRLLIRDAVERGFGMPSSNISNLNARWPSSNLSTPVRNLLKEAHRVFEERNFFSQ